MNAIWLLMGLLLLSYIGSFLVGGRAIRGFGLPSGTEYVFLGFLFGPAGLGLLDRATLSTFEPFAHVALGWLMFVVGVTYGVTDGKRVPTSRLFGGWLVSLLSGAAAAGAVWVFLTWRSPLSRMDRVLVAGGVGAACAETTRYAVRWVVERHLAKGPVSRLIGELAESDDLVPILAVAVLFAFAPSAHPAFSIHWWGWVGVTLGLGLLLGGMAALLLGRTFRLDETWGILLGVSLLAVGTAARLGLATISALFVMGLTLSMLSPHREDLERILAPTERPVMLPALLLAGAYTDFAGTPYLPFVIAIALGARTLSKWLIGVGVVTFSETARPAGYKLGLGLLSAGALAMSIGLAFALRFPGPVGTIVLATAACVTTFGEFVGPASLRHALVRAGEIEIREETAASSKADATPIADDAAAAPKATT